MPPTPADNRDPQTSAPTLRERLKSLAAMPRAAATWAAAHRLRAAAVAVACLASVGGLAAGWAMIAVRPPVEELVTLDMAMEALDRGWYPEAQRLARKLEQQATLSTEEYGGPVFVLGAAAAHQADETGGKEKPSQYLVAARYLEEASRRGFPPGRRAEGLYLLGQSLYLGGRLPAARPVLHEALKWDRQRQGEIRLLLAGAYLHDANPQLDRALEENARCLSDRELPQAVRCQGLLQRAQILLRQGKLAACSDTLNQVSSAAEGDAEAIVVRGQVLIEEARALKTKTQPSAEEQAKTRQKYEAAIQSLRLAESRDTLGSQSTRKAMYLIGLCFLEMDDRRAALAQWERTRTQYPDTAEGVAASFEEAEAMRQAGRDADALAAYRRTLATVTSPENFSNPWITLDQLRARTTAALQHYLAAKDFPISLQLARAMYPLFPRARALELTAEVYHSWGQALLTQAESVPPAKAESLRSQGRTQFRHAGRVHWRLAKLQAATRQYPEHLWNSGNAYFEGQDYRNAVAILRKYLQSETRRRHPQALVRLGEALLATDEPDKALEAFRECVEYHRRDAAAYRARLLAGRIHAERGDLAQAESLLRENLAGEYLTPASKEWRDSLFALGQLLHDQGRYQDAIPRLEEAVQRYPDVPQAVEARYLAADSCRRSAKAAQDKLGQDAAANARAVRPDEVRDLYATALAQYQQVRETLSRRQDTAEATTQERLMLRNCYFAVGSIYFEQAEYEAAVNAYLAAVNRYQHCPEVLEAYIQMAAAYRQLDKPSEARTTLEQAKIALSRMKSEAPFHETTNYSRKQWGELLDSLSNL